jgi:hypothetical protein
VGGGSSRSVAVEATDVNVGHLHTHGKVHSTLETNLHLVGGTNDCNKIIFFVGRQQDGTSGVREEVFHRDSALTNDELVSASLDGQLFQLKLLM